MVGGDISTHRDELRAASPITHVSAAAPPFLIIHGTSDETVPYEQAELLWSALLTSGTETQLLPIAHGHHNLQRDPHRRYGGQVWDYVASEAATFFNRHLRPQDGDHARPRQCP
ncbi:prolyl oligopeptidase family serine peptidase [Kribbella sp. NPDC004875]|uniref:prolyl oligopeptidase family serine peptidase n=1 Tax=Kribbella sp. NPDC004875 TaxID=3364107 RepID=UPI0036B4EA29